MQVAILQLSDVHVRSTSDVVLQRALKIKEAFHSAAPTAEAYYLSHLIRERMASLPVLPTEQEILQRTDEAVIALTFAATFGTIKKISFAVGHHRLAETYEMLLSEFKENIAVGLVDLSVKLDHFAIIPDFDITRMRDKVVGNMFSYTLLQAMVADFMYLYRVDIRTLQKLGSMFEIRSTAPQFLLTDEKRD